MVKINKIYTRTGDDGTTGLVDGSRLSKSHARMHAIGEVDETNSAIGLAIVALEADGDAGAVTAGLRACRTTCSIWAQTSATGESFEPSEMELRIVPAQVTWLEAAIDAANSGLAPLTSFILPGQCACRCTASGARDQPPCGACAGDRDRRVAINPQALAYLNRLSDYLFVLCRLINESRGGDIEWVPGASR